MSGKKGMKKYPAAIREEVVSRIRGDRGVLRNPKTILRIMKKYGLLSEIRRRRKWVNLGQQTHRYKNLLKRQLR